MYAADNFIVLLSRKMLKCWENLSTCPLNFKINYDFKGAFWSLMLGIITGGIRMILNFAYRAPLCGESEYRPTILHKVSDDDYGVKNCLYWKCSV